MICMTAVLEQTRVLEDYLVMSDDEVATRIEEARRESGRELLFSVIITSATT